MRLFSNIFRKRHLVPNWDSKYVIDFAFTSGGIDYYCFNDAFNMPYKRGLKCSTFYEEFRMRTSYEFLKAHTEAVSNILSDPKKIDLFAVKKLNDQLKERLDMIIDPELVYKLASVVYFDKNESPVDYEHKYNEKKIAHWKKHSDVTAFFLSAPIQKLVPFLQESVPNIQAYTDAVVEITQQQLDIIGGYLLPEQKKTLLPSSN